MSTFNSISNFGDDSAGENALDIKHRKSFPVKLENRSRGYKNRNEDFGSTSSGPSSAGSSVAPMSMTDSSFSNESMLTQMQPTVPVNPTSADKNPQLYSPSAAGQFQQANVNRTPIGIPICYQNVQGHPTRIGYPQIQGYPTLANIQHSQPLQPQTFVYPMQQCSVRTQKWARMPISTTSVPIMMHQVSYPSSVVSSEMSTPVFGLSSPGFPTTPYDYISTPALSSASCTPVSYQTAYPEVLPTFNLHKNNRDGCNIPQPMSCNINMGRSSDGCQSTPEKPPASSVNSNNSPLNQPENFKMGVTTGPVGDRAPEQTKENEEDIWPGDVNYAEYQENECSNLFATWSGTRVELSEKMKSHNFQVFKIFTTVDDNIYNVVFESQATARKVFTMQQELGLRIVPPKNSQRRWLRNPSQNFWVWFETKCPLKVWKGKKSHHDPVGELMEGCRICANQYKGNRIRILWCEGKFKFPGEYIVEMNGVPNNSGKETSLGWISYCHRDTKEPFVIRKTSNKLSDYVLKVE